MRKSLEDLDQRYIRKVDDYPNLPEELKEYCYWLADAGYCIMAIPEVLLKEHFGEFDLWQYEVPVPAKYVLEHGWHKFEEYIATDIPYNSEIGLVFDDKYTEF